MGYLDNAGLQYFWGKLKEKFAPKSHSHDDRYYTESEMDGKLNSKVNNNEAGANGLLSKLTTSWTATPTDNTYFIRQDTGGGNEFGRVKFSTLWNYIKGKTDGVYQPKGSYAASNHSHTKDQVGLGNVDNTADANKSVKYATSAGNASKVNNHTVNIDVPANAKFTDTTYGVATASSNGLMSSTDKPKLDDFSRVISIQKQIKLTTDWQDTGIAGNNLETGTYVVQVSGFNWSYTSLYSEIYSGIMSWYSDATNSGNSSEIFLHNAGHADNSNAIYLRTLRTAGNNYLKLQIACKVAATGTDTLTFKFRRLI